MSQTLSDTPTPALTLRPDRLDQPLRWSAPRMIFVNSMSDLFHKAIPEEFITRADRVESQASGIPVR